MWCRSSSAVALVTCLAAGPVTGQVNFGVKAGRSLSDLTVDGVGVYSQEGRRGISAGVMMTLPVSGALDLQLEGSYVPKGATFTLLQLGEVGLRLEYLQLSALAKAHVRFGGSRSSLYVLAGPTIARETSCEVTVVAVLQPITQVGSCDGEELYTPTKDLDFALTGGAGVLFAVTGRMGLTLDVLYAHGLRSIYGGELEWTGYTRSATIQAGLLFSAG